MIPTQAGGSIDKLLAALAPVVGAPRLLVDGPTLTGDASSDTGDAVFVGWNGDLSDATAVDFTQAWRGMGARAKDETLDVRCCCVVWNGDDDEGAMKVRRDAVLATFAVVASALRADPGQGQPGPSIFAITAGSLVQEPQRTRLPFVVSVRARI